MDELKELLALIPEMINGFRDSVPGVIFFGFVLPKLNELYKYIHSRRSKYIVVPIKDENGSKSVTWEMVLELYKSFFPLGAWLLTILIITFLIFVLRMSYDMNILYLIILLVGLLLISRVVHKLKKRIFSKTQIMIMLFLIIFYAVIMLVCFSGGNVAVIRSTILLCALLTHFGVDYCVINRNLLEKYMYTSVKILKLVRVILAVLFVIFLGINMLTETMMLSALAVNAYFIIWIVLCIVEWIILEVKGRGEWVEFQVVLIDDNIFTKKKIEKMNSNKVKVALDNGNEKIVDTQEIKYIQYSLKNVPIKKEIGKVVCFLYDGSMIEYHTKKIIDDNWIRFYTIHKDRCDIILMNSKLVKIIHSEVLL